MIAPIGRRWTDDSIQRDFWLSGARGPGPRGVVLLHTYGMYILTVLASSRGHVSLTSPRDDGDTRRVRVSTTDSWIHVDEDRRHQREKDSLPPKAAPATVYFY